MYGYAYVYACGRRTRFKVENHVKGSNVIGVRVKSTVRKDGSVVSYIPAEQYDEEQGEWKKIKGRHEVSVYALPFPPEKGKGLTIVSTLGLGCILCFYDPQPTWEGEDVDRK